MVYQCACPAQVAELILRSREVYDYEVNCLKQSDHLQETHQTIAETLVSTLDAYEDCLDRVLDIEGWDRDSLEMPAFLRERKQDGSA